MNNSEDDTHRLNAENRMRLLREANLRMFEESSESEDSEEDEEKKNLSDFSLGSLCNNETDLSFSNRFDSIKNRDIITILKRQTSKDYIHECYTLEEINFLVDPENQVYIWYKGSIKYSPIYKLPFSGIWIDTLSMIMLKKFNTFIVESLGKFKIGSYFEASQLHGAIEEVYCLRPIHQKTIGSQDKMSSTPWVAEETDVIFSENVGWRYKEKEKTRILLCPENEFCQVGIAYTLVCEFEEENITSFTCTRYIGQISEENEFIGVGCINTIQEKPYHETIQFSLDDEKGNVQGIKLHRLYMNITGDLSYDKLEKEFTSDYILDIKNVGKEIIIVLANSNFYTELQIGEVESDILEYKIIGQCSKEHRWEIEYKPDQSLNNIIVKGEHKNGKKEGLWEEWYTNGQQKFKHNYKNGKEDGLSEEWYNNGNQKFRTNWKNGKPDGLYEKWYELRSTDSPREKREKRFNFKNGVEDGLSESWYEDGKKQSKINYKNGKENGLYEEWYENGHQKKKFNFKHGIENGLLEEWYNNGNRQSRTNWKNGKPEGLYEKWYEESSVDSPREKKFNFKNGVADGLQEAWYNNGNRQSRTNWKNGVEDGLHEGWYDNGNLQSKSNWENGKQEGLEEIWYLNGQQEFKNNYKDGKKDGVCEEWYLNGQRRSKENWKNGKENGLSEKWYESGEQESKINYKNGKQV